MIYMVGGERNVGALRCELYCHVSLFARDEKMRS